MSEALPTRLERWFPGIAVKRAESRRRLAEIQFEKAVIQHNEKIVRNMSTSGYRSGVPTRLDNPYSNSDWTPVNNALAGGMLANLRNRSRQLEHDNTLASSLLDRAVENVIGNGLKLAARTSDPKFNDAVDKLHQKWGLEQADIRGMFSHNELQQLQYRAMLLDGDVGEILVDRGGIPKLQTIEGDFITNQNTSVGDGVYEGIKWDSTWKPLAFYVRTIDSNNGFNLAYTPVPARNFVYMARMSSTKALRGEPVFAQSFYIFEHFDGYVEAVVAGARAGACQVMLIKKQIGGLTAPTAATTTNSDGNQQRKLKLEPLMVHNLKPGEDVSSFNPAQPQQQFGDFMTALSRLMGLKLGITVEQVLLDFSKTSYTSSRSARLQADETAYKERKLFEEKKLRREHPWWVSKMVNIGELPTPPEDAWAHEWIGEPRPWVDPEKEIRAALIELDMGLTTLTILAKERGREFAQLLAQRQEEIKASRKAGVPYVMSTLTREQGQQAGGAQTTDQNSNGPNNANNQD